MFWEGFIDATLYLSILALVCGFLAIGMLGILLVRGGR